jgi:hypothetical protein
MDDHVTHVLSQMDDLYLCQGFQGGLTRSPVHRNADIPTSDASMSAMRLHKWTALILPGTFTMKIPDLILS